MHFIIDELLVSRGRELVLHILHPQEVVLLRFHVRYILNEKLLLKGTGLHHTFLVVVQDALVIGGHILVFLP